MSLFVFRLYFLFLTLLQTKITRNYARCDKYYTHGFVSDPVYMWSHRDYLGYDDTPLIGKLYPWSKHMFTATGFMKWGLTNGTVAAMILSDAIRGIKNPWVETFDTMRLSPVLSIPKVIRENIIG